MPTLLELAGAPLDGLDGASLLPLARRRDERRPPGVDRGHRRRARLPARAPRAAVEAHRSRRVGRGGGLPARRRSRASGTTCPDEVPPELRELLYAELERVAAAGAQRRGGGRWSSRASPTSATSVAKDAHGPQLRCLMSEPSTADAAGAWVSGTGEIVTVGHERARRGVNGGARSSASTADVLIRRFEETLLDLFAAGKLAGTTHTCIGQEADAAGVISHLEPGAATSSSPTTAATATTSPSPTTWSGSSAR